MENIVRFVGQMDTKWWIVLIVICVILGVVSIIKKGVKLGIFIIALAATISTMVGIYHGTIDKYNPRIENDSLVITIDSKDIVLDRKKIADVDIGHEGAESLIVSLEMKDGTTQELELPIILEDIISIYFN